MRKTSELKIIVPGICGPLAEIDSLKNNRLLNSWIKALSKAQCRPSESSFNEVVASIFKLNTTADIPSACFTLMANDMFDPSLHYMHADPVHLRADMDQAVLTSSADLNIKNDESISLCERLNQHFMQDGLTFFLLNKDQWFVSSKDKIALSTTPLVDATGRNVNFIFPAGKDSVYWKKMLTEAQMLMHSHEVNTVRESAGLLSINSLWFHGCGEMKVIDNCEVSSLCSDHDMLKGLAGQLKCDHMKTPDFVNDYLDYLLSCKNASLNVLHLAELEHLTNYTDTSLWLEQLAQILEFWIYPILKHANKNNMRVILNSCNEREYTFSNYDFLKFWRKSKLEEHVNSYR